MSDFTDFGMGDLLDEGNGKRTAARWAASGLGLVFFLLSALTTAGFFFQYASGIGGLLGPDLAPYMAAAVGVLTLDLASLVWSLVRSHGSNSETQQTLSGIVGGIDLVMALTVSGLYVLLSGSSLSVGVYDAAGGLTSFGRSLHLFGTLVVTVALTLNFGAVWVFAAVSSETRAAAQQTRLAAAVREGQYRVAHMHTKATVQRSLEAIAQRVPQVSQEAAAAAADDYVSHRTRPRQTQPEGVAEHMGLNMTQTQPSPNGAGGHR